MAKKAKTESEAPDAPKKGGVGSVIVMMLAPVLAFGGAFGTSWFLGVDAPAASTPLSSEASADPNKAWAPPSVEKVVTLEPLLISIDENNRVLKIGVSIELIDAEAEVDQLRIKDAFTGYLRAIGPQALSDPGFHSHMKRQLLHRARTVIGPAVQDVLITDFLLTR